MECRYCKDTCIKWGKQSKGKQRYYCKKCKSYQQETYQYKAYNVDIDKEIIKYKKESCGIRSISRLLNVSNTTVIKKIKEISRKIEKPIARDRGL